MVKSFLSDIKTFTFTRIKVMFRSKSVIIAYITALIITGIIAFSMFKASEEKDGLAIGLIDSDKTETSKEFCKRLEENDSLIITTGSYEELEHMLKDSKLLCIFEVQDGFEERVKSGEVQKLFTDYYLPNRENMSIISDIVLSHILDEVCYSICLNKYHEFGEDYDIMSDEEYTQMVKELYSNAGVNFAFDFQVVDVNANEAVSDDVDNSHVFKLVDMAIVGILISFIVLFAANTIIMDKTYRMNTRINISLSNKYARLLGDVLSLFLVSGSYTLITGVVLAGKFGFSKTSDYVIFAFVLILFTLSMDLIFVILTQIINEPIVLQLLGAYLVCALGVLGSFEIIQMILPRNLSKFTALLPNSWLIGCFDDIVFKNHINDKVPVIIATLVLLFSINFMVKYIKKEDNRYEH